MKIAVSEMAASLGFDACRFTTAENPRTAPRFTQWIDEGQHGKMSYLARNAARRINPQEVLPGAKSVVCVALNYGMNPQFKIHNPDSTGVVARYAQHEDYHDVMGDRLRQLSEFIDQQAGSVTRSLWYVDTGPILEREFAQRAGLGFVGKHTNVISRQFGNWILLGEILTTADFEPDVPEKNRCGTCTRCLDACPTHAITAPFELDARLCISYLTIELKESIPVELRPAIGNRIFGCDDCLEVCPWNRFASEARLMREHRLPNLKTPDLLDLLSLDDAGFKDRFLGTPLIRSKRRGLLRNVCVALGNVGNQTVLPSLEQATRDSEPLIAEHARWAIEAIEKRLAACSSE